MKNQYFGDINDYRKYALLRCLAEFDFRVGVCWMLTAPDGRNDGNKTSYLQQPAAWRRRDPALFDFLQDVVAAGERDVQRLESSGLLRGARFHSEVLTDNRALRVEYFANALNGLRGTDVLFFDPDTGLEVPSYPMVGQSRAATCTGTKSRKQVAQVRPLFCSNIGSARIAGQ